MLNELKKQVWVYVIGHPYLPDSPGPMYTYVKPNKDLNYQLYYLKLFELGKLNWLLYAVKTKKIGFISIFLCLTNSDKHIDHHTYLRIIKCIFAYIDRNHIIEVLHTLILVRDCRVISAPNDYMKKLKRAIKYLMKGLKIRNLSELFESNPMVSNLFATTGLKIVNYLTYRNGLNQTP